MRGLLARVRSLVRRITRARQLDREMRDEFRFHIDMEDERLVRERGLDPNEARRLAFVNFGGVEKYKEAGRETRGFPLLDAISLDARLGARMLVKYPGLTLVGSFAIAVAIAIGAMFFEGIAAVLYSTLPFEEGDRVVAIHLATNNPMDAERRALHAFGRWRQDITSVQALSAFRNSVQNLAIGHAVPDPVRVAAITASGFHVPRVPPMLGRYIVADDESAAAADVLVIGYDAWQRRFHGDPTVVGRVVTLDGRPHTLVGVMPEGFRFPVDHEYWTALRDDPSTYGPLQGPEIFMFGRLSPDASIASAQVELSAVSERMRSAAPEEYRRLRPRVLPYTREHVDVNDPRLAWLLWMVQVLVSGLLIVVAVNLAILVYARTVARFGEIAIRSALGASRGRILAQLFMEAFALAALGAAVGLFVAQAALTWLTATIKSVERIPFWIDLNVSPATVLYGLALAAVAAAITGVVPGMKATSRAPHNSLRELTAASAPRLGRVWTSLVVAQVAIAVMVLPLALFTVWEVVRMEMAGPGFPADQIVIAKLRLNETRSLVPSELIARLQSLRGATAVTYSTGVPGYEAGSPVEVEPTAGFMPVDADGEANVNLVDLQMFSAYGATLVSGRQFTASDLGRASSVAIVNQAFLRQFVGNRNPLGLRFRYSRAPQSGESVTWYEIVGVIDDLPRFPSAPGAGEGTATVYHPATLAQLKSLVIAVRFANGLPSDAMARIREVAASVDPALALRSIEPLSDFYQRNRALWQFIAWALAILTSSVVALSAAGIYALTSFTVTQRTREIGIRIALGAPAKRLLAHIFGRTIRQLSAGVIAGAIVSIAALTAAGLGPAPAATILAIVAGVILLVGVLAAVGPARRGLRIQAIDALRADG
jgi:predicted permease